MAKRPSSLSMARWQVSARGTVAHIRIGTAATTVCGEVITKTGKLVASGAMNPPCLKCSEALKAAKRAVAEKQRG